MNSQPQTLTTAPKPNYQFTLFTPSSLPRKLPILKSGPEDEPKVTLVKH